MARTYRPVQRDVERLCHTDIAFNVACAGEIILEEIRREVAAQLAGAE